MALSLIRKLRRICYGCVGVGVLVLGWGLGLWVWKLRGAAALGAGDTIEFCQGAEGQSWIPNEGPNTLQRRPEA